MGHAIAYLNRRHIHELLDLPPNVKVESVFIDFVRDAIGIHLSGNDLPECEIGAIPQEISAHLQTCYIADDECQKVRTAIRIVVNIPQQ